MPIDPSIPLQVQQLKLESPVNQLAMMGDAMKIGEMQRGIGVQNELRNLYSQGVDISTPEGFKQVASIDPATAMKLRTDALKGQELQGNIKKTGLEITAKDLEIQREKLGNLAFNPSNENVKAHLQDSVLAGKLTPQAAEQQWMQVANMNAPQRKQYFTEMGVKTEERFKMAETQRHNKATEGIAGGHLQIARENQQRGTIPAGYRMSADGKNLEAIPGGPTTTNLSPKEMQAREAKYPMATQAVKTFEAKSTELENDLIALRNHPGLASITGIAAGRAPGITKEGRAAQVIYDRILARGGFKELQDMRAASPTGGALGNVSNQEGQFLRQAFSGIDRVQDKSDVQKAIDQTIIDLQGSKSRVREAYDMTYDYKPSSGGGATPPPPSPPPGAGGNTVTIPGGKVLTFPTPEAAAAYKKAAGL
jgi:hypothetical protein